MRELFADGDQGGRQSDSGHGSAGGRVAGRLPDGVASRPQRRNAGRPHGGRTLAGPRTAELCIFRLWRLVVHSAQPRRISAKAEGTGLFLPRVQIGPQPGQGLPALVRRRVAALVGLAWRPAPADRDFRGQRQPCSAADVRLPNVGDCHAGRGCHTRRGQRSGHLRRDVASAVQRGCELRPDRL